MPTMNHSITAWTAAALLAACAAAPAQQSPPDAAPIYRRAFGEMTKALRDDTDDPVDWPRVETPSIAAYRAAPWPELLPPLDKRDAKLVQQGQVPRRDWLTAGVGGGYDEMQTSEAWTVLFPIRAGNPNFSHDQLRVGVIADSVNLHIAGQEESPLLGGETYGRILPASCTWRVLPAEQVDGLLVEKIELRLVKEVAGGGMWRALFKGQYT